MIKKIALVFLFIGVTIGFALLLYNFFFKGAPSVQPTPSGGPTAPAGGLPTAGVGRPTTGAAQPGAPTALPPAAPVSAVAQGGVTAVRDVTVDPVMSPMTAPNGALGYYDANDGRFYRVSPDGSSQAMSEARFPSAQSVTWSHDGQKAIIQFPDSSKVVYDFAQQKQVAIPSHWEDPTFSDGGNSIVAKSMTLDPDNRWLVSMSTDGSKTKLIEPLGDNGDKVTVSVSPDSSIVAFSDTAEPVGFDTRDLLPIGQNGENFKSLRVEGFGFTPLWSPDDQHLLYSTASQGDAYLPSLWLVNANGDSMGAGRTNLEVHTWADKCTFAGTDTVYCAVPNTLPEGAGLQRDIANGTPDHIEAIDLKSGTSRVLARPEQDTTINTLTVSADGSSLFYASSLGQLQQIRLR